MYFDSYLPRSKRAVRIQRLIDSSRGLVRYYSEFFGGVPKGSSHTDKEVDIDLFPHAWPGERRPKPPPPAFLVPAVIDALKDSPTYKDLVKLVPGEADGFCARHVRLEGGIVLTSDSDLLIHDLGVAGTVIFFQDLEADLKTKTLSGPQYQLADLCKRLSIQRDTGLRHLAFELSRDPHLTLKQAVEKVKRGETAVSSRDAYTLFVQEYLSPEVMENSEADQVLTLDPRVSEIALQSLRSTSTMDPVSGNISANPARGDAELEIYLPLLLECPSRTSAWEASKPVRQLAYAILQTIRGDRISSVQEMRRMLSASSGSRVDVPSVPEIDELGASLFAVLSSIETAISTAEISWIVFAIYQDIVMTIDRGKSHPLILALLGRETRGQLDECSWDFLHCLAQTQATYYSLRMLSQLLEFAAHHGWTVSATILELADLLSRLPPLSAFPSPRTFAETLRLMREAGGLSCLQGLCAGFEGIPRLIASIQEPHDADKKKSKATRSTETEKRHPRTYSNNPFDVLAEDQE